MQQSIKTNQNLITGSWKAIQALDNLIHEGYNLTKCLHTPRNKDLVGGLFRWGRRGHSFCEF
jgi:hypothetical protein